MQTIPKQELLKKIIGRPKNAGNRHYRYIITVDDDKIFISKSLKNISDHFNISLSACHRLFKNQIKFCNKRSEKLKNIKIKKQLMLII